MKSKHAWIKSSPHLDEILGKTEDEIKSASPHPHKGGFHRTAILSTLMDFFRMRGFRCGTPHR